MHERIRAEDGQVSSWLIKLIVIVAVVGFAVLEGGAIVVNRIQAQDIAGRAATEAGFVYSGRGDVDAATARATEVTEQLNAEFVALAVDQGAREIAVTVKKTANTRLLHRFEQTAGMTVAEVTERAPLRQ